MVAAQKHAFCEAGGAAVSFVLDVVDFAGLGGLAAAAVVRQALGLAPSQSATAGRSLVPAMREPPDDTGLAYPETADDAAANATRLWQVDLADPTELTRGRVDPARWNDASLRWLVDPASCRRAQ